MMKIARRFGFLAAVSLVASLSYATPVEIVHGSQKLVLYPETGRFSLLKLAPVGKNRFEPLFDDRNSSSTSFFSVSSNGRVFKLEKKNGRPVVFDKLPDGGKFTFTLTDDFQVVQTVSFVGGAGAEPLGVRVETAVENTSGKPATFACKALFDTSLGESTGLHFSTDIRNRVSTETKFDPSLDPDRYVLSANAPYSLLFALKGPSISTPAAVYAANWDRLNTLAWLPEFVTGRSFNTIYSVNDSALLFVWPEKKLEANESAKYALVLGPSTPELLAYSAEPASQRPGVPVAKASVSADKAVEAEKNELVEQILARIAEINANPSSASDDELAKLNGALDLLLNSVKE